ncbi:DEAD/DEAH box helicase [Candidatus Poribacteria bacterium]|nr:DEAD/DEAH box helicase [Candidatus Poribacteria bacterium]
MTQTSENVTLREIFSPGGLISQQLEAYEFRQEQLQMAHEVARAFTASEHLIVEAGTGVGKSFAYLIPAISLALKSEQKVVISTNTISLQEQLVTKDIPFLQRVLPRDFNVVLAKGRRNYLSRRRLKNLMSYERGLFDTREEVEEIVEIEAWVNSTVDGSRADLPWQPQAQVWDKVVSDRDNCLGRNCETYDTCFYFKARREMYNADLLIVNHHLLFSDLAIRKNSEAAMGVLPDYDYLIIDEAHHLEATATNHASIDFSNTRVKWLLDSLYNERSEDGLAKHFNSPHLKTQTQTAREQANVLFRTIIEAMQEDTGSEVNGNTLTPRIHKSNFVKNVLDAPLVDIEKTLKRLRDDAMTDDDEQEIVAHQHYCRRLRDELDMIIRQTDPDYVYWADISTRGRTPRILLNATPANVNQMLQDQLFTIKNSVVMTSATLATNRNFAYFKKRVGINECRELLVKSPFDFKRQVQIHIPRDMPDPRSYGYVSAAIEKIKHYLKLTHGKAFVLFTSYKMMDEVYDAVAPELEEIGIETFKQGGELSRTAMLQAFREDTDSVLFGTSSFWEGVDVRGASLSNVIITRLPFEVPTHPVMEARVKQIKEAGGNEFFEFSLPEAILRLKQGFGRLIRTQTDNGIVVILDPRIRTANYGRQFLESLPDCEIVEK